MKVTLRDYRPTDRRHLARCLDGVMDHLAGLDPWHRLARRADHSSRSIRALLAHVRDDHGFVLVAEADGVAAGVSVAWLNRITPAGRTAERPTRSGYVSDLAVLPEWRGHGIGTTLLRATEARFRKAGCDQLTLGVFFPNTGATRLYEREGFAVRSLQLAKELGPPLGRWPSERRKKGTGRRPRPARR